MRPLYEFLKRIDLGTIARAILAGLGGVWGRILSLVAGPVADSIERAKDDALDRAIGAEELKTTDGEIDAKAQSDLARIKSAKSDDDLDAAARDSLR